MESPDGETIDPTGAAPYKLSRAAMRERYGARAIDGSAPHSPSDTMSGIAEAPGGMLSQQSAPGSTGPTAWDRYFKPPPLPAAYPSVAPPTTTPDPKGIADFAQEQQLSFSPNEPTVLTNGRNKAPSAFEPLPSPVDYVAAAQSQHEAWFDRAGIPRPKPGAARPVQYGDKFKNRYGTGSVSSVGDYRSKLAGKYAPAPDSDSDREVDRKLRLLGLTDDGDDWGL